MIIPVPQVERAEMVVAPRMQGPCPLQAAADE